MLFDDYAYTPDRAELWIVSQTPRGPTLFNTGNTVDSEDRQMIDGIGKAPIVTASHRSGVC